MAAQDEGYARWGSRRLKKSCKATLCLGRSSSSQPEFGDATMKEIKLVARLVLSQC